MTPYKNNSLTPGMSKLNCRRGMPIGQNDSFGGRANTVINRNSGILMMSRGLRFYILNRPRRQKGRTDGQLESR